MVDPNTFSPWLLMGAAWVALGVHQVLFAAEYQDKADERRLKWNFGSRHDRRWWQGERGVGFLYIAGGVVLALTHIRDNGNADPRILQLMGALLMALGTWRILAEPHVAAWLQRLHQRRLQARLARGTDAHFEELRALEAYPPSRTSTASRNWSAAMAIIFGAGFLLLGLS